MRAKSIKQSAVNLAHHVSVQCGIIEQDFKRINTCGSAAHEEFFKLFGTVPDIKTNGCGNSYAGECEPKLKCDG